MEHFRLLEPLKDSKISYLFNRLSQCRILSFSKTCLAILFSVIKKTNQLNCHWKIIFLYSSEIWDKMDGAAWDELFLFFKKLEALILELYILAGSKYS